MAFLAKPGIDISHLTVHSKVGKLKAEDIYNLTCSICTGILSDPVQVTCCGHRFCRACLNAQMSDADDSMLCPMKECDELFSSRDVKADKGCLKEMHVLTVHCPVGTVSCCPWKGPLSKLKQHLEECLYMNVACPSGCGGNYIRSQCLQHISQCSKRAVFCDYCSTSVSMDTLQIHHISCENYPVTCDYCHQELLERKELEKHLDEECPGYLMKCPWEDNCCTFKGRKVDMLQHMNEAHTLQAFEKIMTLTKEVSALQDENQKLTTKVDKICNRMDSFEKFMKYGAEIPDAVEADSAREKRKPKTQSYSRGRLLTRAVSHYHDSAHRRIESGGSEVMSNGLVYFDTEKDCAGQQPCSVQGSIHILMKKIEAQQTKLEHIGDRVQEVQQNMTHHTLVIDDLRLRQDVLDVKTTNGVFIWKVPDVRRRYKDAVECKTISLYSPPFLTSPHGYRMCIRAYLNGDGLGKGTHISVFFVLMRSEHDSLLTWPFKQRVKFTLINQRDSESSISEAFRPDLESPSFQRPKNDMNIASGFPKFVRQSILHDDAFTKDNTLYIKAEVDLCGLNLQ